MVSLGKLPDSYGAFSFGSGVAAGDIFGAAKSCVELGKQGRLFMETNQQVGDLLCNCGWLRNPEPPKGWLKHVETI